MFGRTLSLLPLSVRVYFTCTLLERVTLETQGHDPHSFCFPFRSGDTLSGSSPPFTCSWGLPPVPRQDGHSMTPGDSCLKGRTRKAQCAHVATRRAQRMTRLREDPGGESPRPTLERLAGRLGPGCIRYVASLLCVLPLLGERLAHPAWHFLTFFYSNFSCNRA